MNACVDIKILIHLYSSGHGRVHDDQRLCRWLWDPHYWHWDHPNVALRGVLFWQKVETTRRSILGSDCEELIVQSSKRPETILRQSLLKYVLYVLLRTEREKRKHISDLTYKMKIEVLQTDGRGQTPWVSKSKIEISFLKFSKFKLTQKELRIGSI